MTAITYENQSKNNNFLKFIFLSLIIVLAVAVCHHALAGHGTKAIVASQCADKPDYIFLNPEKNRFGYTCLMDNGKWGVVILDKSGKMITSFIKEKFTKAEQIFKYMNNTGYKLIKSFR
jgi:hypothetical protein